MATIATLIPVEDYLASTYRPDCDYVDGEVLERNMGETPHARLQGYFYFIFRLHQEDWQVEPLLEQRVQVASRRYRVPDVLLAGLPNLDERIVRTPPLLCIEILSSEDRMSSVRERLRDYAAMGVQAMWVVDPWRRTAFTAGANAVLQETEGMLAVPGTPIAVAVSEIFAELDRLEQRAADGKTGGNAGGRTGGGASGE